MERLGPELGPGRDGQLVTGGLRVATSLGEQLVGHGIDGLQDRLGCSADELAVEHHRVEGGTEGQPIPGPVVARVVTAIGIQALGDGGHVGPPAIEASPRHQIDQDRGHGIEAVGDAGRARLGQHPGVVAADPAVVEGVGHRGEVGAQRPGRAHPLVGDPGRQLRLPSQPGARAQPVDVVGDAATVELAEQARLETVDGPSRPLDGQHRIAQRLVAQRGNDPWTRDSPERSERLVWIEHVFDPRTELRPRQEGPARS